MRIADYIARYIAKLGIKHVFGVTGGGIMHLTDAFANTEGTQFVATHHEQAAAFAAESYAKLNGLGCCLVTTGPGGTNAITGVASAFIDSAPVIFIGGQVTQDTVNYDVRQNGVQEGNNLEIVRSVVKKAVSVDAGSVDRQIHEAVRVAMNGRPGPVWLEVPLDIQSRECDYDLPERAGRGFYLQRRFSDEMLDILHGSERPVLILGNGARGGPVIKFLEELSIPCVTSWAAADMVGVHPYCFGRIGLFGDRAANLIMQNADLIIAIGCRLGIPHIGYRHELWAREAKVIMVDIDEAEMHKRTLHVDYRIHGDAPTFMSGVVVDPPEKQTRMPWWTYCVRMSINYPVVTEQHRTGDQINPFYFVECLAKALPDDAVVVTDVGTAFTATFQAARMKRGQRWIASFGHAPMGWGLPAAVGAAFATGKPVTCIVGDGGIQFNIQELQTIATHKLPITIYVINNGGYVAISHMQRNHFRRLVGSTPESGLGCPDLCAIADAYGIPAFTVFSRGSMEQFKFHDQAAPAGPLIVELRIPHDIPLHPRVGSFRREDGSVSSRPLEDMAPFLDRDEFMKNMLVEPVKESM